MITLQLLGNIQHLFMILIKECLAKLSLTILRHEIVLTIFILLPMPCRFNETIILNIYIA